MSGWSGSLSARAAAVLAAVVVAGPASANPSDDLYGMLPAGYDEGVCQPVDVPPSDPGPAHLIFIHDLMFGNAIGSDFQSLLQWMAKSRALGEKLNW